MTVKKGLVIITPLNDDAHAGRIGLPSEIDQTTILLMQRVVGFIATSIKRIFLVVIFFKLIMGRDNF